MNIQKIKIFVLLSVLFLFSGCIAGPEFPEPYIPDALKVISLQGEIAQVNLTRVHDSGFSDGDQVGVYIVNLTEGDEELKDKDNHVDNLPFEFLEDSHTWNSPYPVYWKDAITPVDAYGYFPYTAELSDIHSYPFSIYHNQNEILADGLTGYEASDFLWAHSSNIMPTENVINLSFQHLMSGVSVSLVEGDGFEEGEWDGLDKTVMVNNLVHDCKINLQTGTVTPVYWENSSKGIVAMAQGQDEFRCVIVPQSIEADCEILSIGLGEDSYVFKQIKSIEFISGKLYRYTLRVDAKMGGDYRFTLVNEDIVPWESDKISHEGINKQYLVVHNPVAGEFSKVMENLGYDLEQIRNIKITGEMNEGDFGFLRQRFTYLNSINLKEVKLKNCLRSMERSEPADDVLPYNAFQNMTLLRYIIFPDNMTVIGDGAFNKTCLTGSLTIPEGVKYIGDGAFGQYEAPYGCHLTGTLYLPSTLEYVGNSAFEGTSFTGDLVLPESLTHIGVNGFSGNRWSCRLILPSHLEYLGDHAFNGCNGLVGMLTIPLTLNEIRGGAFYGTSISSVEFHDGITSIGDIAFARCRKLNGCITLPSSLLSLGSEAFQESSISGVEFNQDIRNVGIGCFSSCPMLQDTIKWPAKVEYIPSSCFARCPKLEIVEMPSTMLQIHDLAFMDCFSLNQINCDALIPPQLSSNAFNGVAKDNFTVVVPESAVESYRADGNWREFKRIGAYRNFIARPSYADVLNMGGKRTVILNSDAEWYVAEKPDWVTLSAESGTHKTTLTIEISPMPHGSLTRVGDVVFKQKGDAENSTYYRVTQYDYEYDEDSGLLLQKAGRGSGINVCFIGEGYNAADISNGLYLSDMHQSMEYLFAVEPYKTYRDYFNVYTVFAMSYDSGIGTVNTLRQTKFGTNMGNGTLDSRIKTDASEIIQYVVDNVESLDSQGLACCVIANTGIYDGVTTLWSDGTSVAFVTKSESAYPNDARGLVQHELGGHALGHLADEYVYHHIDIDKCPCFCCEHSDALLEGQAVGMYRNVTLENDYRKSPWSHLIFDDRYSDIVDMWEGGFFHSWGVYRSEYQSCMGYNIPYFSTWSRQLIVERIKKLAGEEFNLDEFFSNDSRDWGGDVTSVTKSSTAAYDMDTDIINTPPILIKGSPNIRK